jgi:hypothetical protein
VGAARLSPVSVGGRGPTEARAGVREKDLPPRVKDKSQHSVSRTPEPMKIQAYLPSPLLHPFEMALSTRPGPHDRGPRCQRLPSPTHTGGLCGCPHLSVPSFPSPFACGVDVSEWRR